MVTRDEADAMAHAVIEKAGGIPFLLQAITNAIVDEGFASIEAVLAYCDKDPKGKELMELYKASEFTEETSVQFIITHAKTS